MDEDNKKYASTAELFEALGKNRPEAEKDARALEAIVRRGEMRDVKN